MRWLFQRELGGSMIFFHEVTIPRVLVSCGWPLAMSENH
jgi:hypothetical protein